MEAHRLELRNFRNYTEQSLDFGPGVNIFFGDNAQGKTNILEAIYLFSMGKASRAHRDAELIRHGETTGELALDFADGNRVSRAEMTLFRNRRKTVTVNEIPIRKYSELVGRFRVVYFGPEYLSLIKEGPKQRRKNADILISQLRPNYFSALSNLKKIIESKNALLKMDHPNIAMLEILNEKLSAIAGEIMLYRRTYIEKMGCLAAEIQKDISGGKEALTMEYLSCVGDLTGLEQGEIQSRVQKRLEEGMRRELDYREAMIGPHREDISYLINGQEAKLYASQGQQKTIVLVQKLSEVALMQEETGELPVLLLDDIMSELDKKRQTFILNHIQKMQILITCTEVDGFNLGKESRLFQVENGTAKQVKEA